MRDVFTIVGGTSLAQLINAIATPVLSRIFLPEAFGVAGLFISIATILSTIACLRYEIAILLPEEDRDAANLLAISLLSSIFTSLMVWVLLPLWQTPLTGWLQAPQLPPFLVWVPLAMGAIGLYQAFNQWNIRLKRYSRLSLLRVVAAMATVAIQIVLGLVWGARPGGLIAGFTTGFAAGILVIGVITWKDDFKLLWGSIALRRTFANLSRYRKFPLVDSWGVLINAISWQAVPLLLIVYFTQAQVGHYFMAYRLVQLPVSFISVAMSQVLMQRCASLKNQPDQLARFVASVFDKLVSLGLFPAALLAILGKDLLVIFLGSPWEEAGVYIQILGIWMFFWFASYPLSTLTGVFERQGTALAAQFIILVTRIVSLVAGGIFGDVYLALALFAASGIVVYTGYGMFCLHLASVPLRSALHTLLRYGGYAALGFTALAAFKSWFEPSPLVFLSAGGLVFMLYAVFVLRKDFSLQDLGIWRGG